jgi:hypothetical protein
VQTSRKNIRSTKPTKVNLIPKSLRDKGAPQLSPKVTIDLGLLFICFNFFSNSAFYATNPKHSGVHYNHGCAASHLSSEDEAQYATFAFRSVMTKRARTMDNHSIFNHFFI